MDIEYLVKELLHSIDFEHYRPSFTDKRQTVRIGALNEAVRDSVKYSSMCMYNGAPYAFNGKCYEKFQWYDLDNLVYELSKSCGLPSYDFSRLFLVVKSMRGMIGRKRLELDRSIIIFRNCVLTLDDMQTHAFDREFRQVNIFDYDYEPDALPMLWTQFLDEVLPDKTYQNILQEFLGSIFVSKDAHIEKMMFLWGSGANGKSVIGNTIMGMLGKQNYTNIPLKSQFFGGDVKSNRATMNGKLLNYITESQTIRIRNEALDAFKLAASREPVEARQLYGTTFMADDLPLQIQNCNMLPDFQTFGLSVRRRLLVIPFKVNIPEDKQDKELSSKMSYEYPAIMNWILEGRQRLRDNDYKFTESEEMEILINNYQATSNNVMMFLFKNGLTAKPKSNIQLPVEITSVTFYDAYKKWCVLEDEHMMTQKGFATRLKDAGFANSHGRNGTNYVVYGWVKRTMEESMKKKEYNSAKNKVNYTPFEENGRMYVKGYIGLSKLTGVSADMLKKYADRFDGCYYQKGLTKMYDIELANKVLDDLDLRNAGHLYQKREITASQVKQKMRSAFNARMINNGLPFRKYSPKFGTTKVVKEGTIWVQDEFVYDNSKEYDVTSGANEVVENIGGRLIKCQKPIIPDVIALDVNNNKYFDNIIEDKK